MRPWTEARRALGLSARLPAYRSFRRFGWPVLSPLFMSFVVTDRCNSRCLTCNIGTRYLDDPSVADGELTLGEYEQLFTSIGRPLWVTFSGGEPFLRRDFAAIVRALARRVRPRVINIPTNATLVERTAHAIGDILRDLGETRLVVNFSVDGLGEEHDRVRGFPGNFTRLQRLYAELRTHRDPRLVLGVNTVLSRFNVAGAETLFDFVHDELRPDSYVLEIAQTRPEYHNMGEDLRGERRELNRALESFLARGRRTRRYGVPRLVQAFRDQYYADARRGLVAPVAHECYAAFATCSVLPKGEVWSNTARAESLGNLREHGLDFAALWRSEQATAVRQRVKSAPCTCELSNTSYANMLMDFSALPRVLWRYLEPGKPQALTFSPR